MLLMWKISNKGLAVRSNTLRTFYVLYGNEVALTENQNYNPEAYHVFTILPLASLSCQAFAMLPVYLMNPLKKQQDWHLSGSRRGLLL